VVNVASYFGHTPQYAGLQALHERYRARGFTVLGVPCNQFGREEPGTPQEIVRFRPKTDPLAPEVIAAVEAVLPA
jgi:glutathione peroxidase